MAQLLTLMMFLLTLACGILALASNDHVTMWFTIGAIVYVGRICVREWV